MSTTRLPDRRTADRLDIADTTYRYAEAMDHIGAHPVPRGAPDPALAQATEILRTCLTAIAILRLYVHGAGDEPIQAGPGGPEAFAPFVREYFTAYGFTNTYRLVGHVRIAFTGADTADVRSYINSAHWVKLSGLGAFSRSCDVAGWRPIVEQTLDAFGPARCFFGSNFPIESLWTGYDNLLGVMRACLDGLSADERHQVLAGTATRLYGL